MIQIALVVKPNEDVQILIEAITKVGLAFETLEAQPGIASIAQDMGLKRQENNLEQQIVLINLSVENQFSDLAKAVQEVLKYQASGIDFLILPQSAQAYEISDFEEKLRHFEDCQELCFIQLIEQDGKLFTLGLEAWSKPDIMLNQQDSAQEMLTEVAELMVKTGLKEKEKVEFENGIYKAVMTDTNIQPDGLQNSLGLLRLVKQV